MKIDVQKFMELRNGAIARQAGTQAKSTGKADWRELLEAKRKEIGLQPAAQQQTAKVFTAKAENKIRAAATDFEGSIEERVSALRERSAEGLPVRERGNFIDVRA